MMDQLVVDQELFRRECWFSLLRTFFRRFPESRALCGIHRAFSRPCASLSECLNDVFNVVAVMQGTGVNGALRLMMILPPRSNYLTSYLPLPRPSSLTSTKSAPFWNRHSAIGLSWTLFSICLFWKSIRW